MARLFTQQDPKLNCLICKENYLTCPCLDDERKLSFVPENPNKKKSVSFIKAANPFPGLEGESSEEDEPGCSGCGWIHFCVCDGIGETRKQWFDRITSPYPRPEEKSVHPKESHPRAKEATKKRKKDDHPVGETTPCYCPTQNPIYFDNDKCDQPNCFGCIAPPESRSMADTFTQLEPGQFRPFDSGVKYPPAYEPIDLPTDGPWFDTGIAPHPTTRKGRASLSRKIREADKFFRDWFKTVSGRAWLDALFPDTDPEPAPKRAKKSPEAAPAKVPSAPKKPRKPRKPRAPKKSPEKA